MVVTKSASSGKGNTSVKRIKKLKGYSHIGTRITENEIAQFLQRKKDREAQRVKQLERKEQEELSQCTFKPKLIKRKS